MRKFTFFVIVFATAYFFSPSLARAAVLANPYTLTSISTVQSSTPGFATATISGQVSGLPGVTVGASTPLQIKYGATSGYLQLQADQAFPPAPNGAFSYTVGNTYHNLACGGTYRFVLYDVTSNNQISVLLPDGTTTQYFDLFMNCGPGASGAGNILSTASTDVLQGVNWGNITTGDHSINISNGRLIPVISTGQKSFQIEYGLADPNQPNTSTYNPLEIVSGFTLNYPYNLSFQINPTPSGNNPGVQPLEPATNYYFDIWEVDGGGVATGLTTYGYATTGPVPSNNTHWQATDTTLHVFGQLMGTNGFPVVDRNIIIRVIDTINGQMVLNTPNAIVASVNATTTNFPGGSTDITLAGNFDHTFSGLTPGGQYFISIVDASSQNNLINPIPVTMSATPGQNTQGSGVDFGTPTYSGLVSCGNNPNGYDCTFEKLIDTVNRVINFLIFFVAFPLVAIVIAWAGILLLTSGGNTAKVSQAKGMIGKVLIGLIVALLCWVIIKLLLMVLGYQGPLLGVFGLDNNYVPTSN